MNTKSDSHNYNAADFALVLEDLTRIMIRLPSIQKYSFTTLSVLHTLTLKSSMRLTELTATEQVTQSGITQLVTRLERDGLVERRSDPKDGRVVQVHITDAGKEVIDSRRNDRIAQLSSFMEGLTPEERQAISSAIPAMQRLATLGKES